MAKTWLKELQATEWKGVSELWLDPEGNNVDLCECNLIIEPDGLSYTWSYEGIPKKGSFVFYDGGAIWTDSWHQPKSTKCVDVANSWGLFTVESSYAAPSSPSWGWRSKLSERPDGSLVLQMTNIAPWGEESRAVRMKFERVNSKA